MSNDSKKSTEDPLPTFIPIISLTKWRKLDSMESEKDLSFGKSLETMSSGEGEFPGSGNHFMNSNSSPPYRKYAGIIFGLLAAASFSTSSLTAKLLAGKKYHTFNIALWKYQGMTLFGPFLIFYFSYFRKVPILDTIWPLTKSKLRVIFFLLLRGTVGVCTMMLQTQSLRYLSLADSSLITFSTPIAVSLFARICLREPCGIVSFILAVTTFTGVCILARPPILTGGSEFEINILIGISFAFTSMLFLSSVFIIIRLIREAHFSLFITFYGYLASLETLTLAYGFDVLGLPQTKIDYLIAAGSSILSLCGQFFLTMALQADLAGLVSLVRTGDVVFAFMWQIILGSVPDIFSFIGAAIIVSCIMTTGFNKWLGSIPEDHQARKRFWFLLK